MKDVLFERWWLQVSEGKDMPSTKAIAYGAWQAGIRYFINAQEPKAWWASNEKSSDHVTFDKNLADKWEYDYNMPIVSLYDLPSTEISNVVSKECNDD